MNKKVIIVGAFHEVIELVEELGFEIVGLIDNCKIGSYRSYEIFSNDKEAKNIHGSKKNVPLIITPDIPHVRSQLFSYYNELGFKFISIISNNACISKSAIVSSGTIVQSGVNVSAECKIGRFVKLNTKCNIMHNSIVDDFTTIAPNAVILGNVQIGKYCYIGSNSTILSNIKICENVTIGAGAVVTKNVDVPSTLVGNPASLIQSKKI